MKIFFWSLVLAGAIPVAGDAAFNDFEDAPHAYWSTPPRDAATRLHERMEKGEVRLPGGDPLTFLKAYLRALEVPETSQTLVFSKTALQRQHVHAANPRAIYFNEDVSVGYIPGARLEVAAVDPALGGIFYIFDLPGADGEVPKFERPARCLGCHAGSFTSFLPGLMTNSVFAQEDGRVAGTARAHFSGHAAPLADRWGGWIVTGQTAGLRHLGSLLSTPGPEQPVTVPFGEPGGRVDASRYLQGARGDVGAMLVLDHTIGAVNRLMEANYRVRTALYEQGVRGDSDEAALAGGALEVAREQAAVLTRYVLFADEAELPAAGMRVDPDFHADYRAGGTADEHGRSLRELSLEGRLFRYRCSPMIDSTAFRGLPKPFRRIFWQSLRDALGDTASTAPAAHLPAEERAAIVSILRATAPEFREVEAE